MHRVVFNVWADHADPRSMTLGYSSAPERDDFSSNRHPAPSSCLSMISAQTLRVCREGKPVPTHRVVARGHAFPDHALDAIALHRIFPGLISTSI
jgi:hypothetical protein